MSDEVRVPIRSDADMVPARAAGRGLALQLGFSRTDATLIATAISEIARNIVVHAGEGVIVMEPIDQGRRAGLVVRASDDGPGIRDVEAVLEQRVSLGPGLGLGLPGARRLMDEFELESEPGRGTTVTMRKWRIRDELELLRERRRRTERSTSGGPDRRL
jgi:anti-sigma regulatory factor (Ser/Thr protein kinase)